MTKKGQKNRRNNTKFPALKPHLNLRTRYELIDYDYINKLSDEEKEWLNKFTEEYVNDNLDREKLRNNLHKTKKLKKDCDDRNNARNRDILTRVKAYGHVDNIDELKESDIINENFEDELIKKIELERLNNLKKAKNCKNSKKKTN